MPRAQAALEYLGMVGVQVLVIAALLVYASNVQGETNTKLNTEKAYNSVNKISDVAQVVYLQGKPAKQTIVLDFPSNIESINVTGHEVLFKVKLSSATSDAYAYSPVLLNGSIQVTSGTTYVTIEAKDGFVQVNG